MCLPGGVGGCLREEGLADEVGVMDVLCCATTVGVTALCTTN